MLAHPRGERMRYGLNYTSVCLGCCGGLPTTLNTAPVGLVMCTPISRLGHVVVSRTLWRHKFYTIASNHMVGDLEEFLIGTHRRDTSHSSGKNSIVHETCGKGGARVPSNTVARSLLSALLQ